MRAAAGAQAPPRKGGQNLCRPTARDRRMQACAFFCEFEGGVSACPLARAKRTSNGAAKGVR